MVSFRLREKYENFKQLLKSTPIEIFICGALGLSLATAFSYRHESARTNLIPLAFSEITQIEKDAEYAGEEVGPMTRFLTSTNDMAMKIFESWNYSHQQSFLGNSTRFFASDLETKMGRDYKFHHYQLDDFLKALPEQAQNVLEELKDFNEGRKGASIVNSHFDRAWDDSHIDHYRTEIETETYTDADGNVQTRTVARQVYDHTTHIYTYHKGEGEAAADSLQKLLAEYPELVFKEKLRTASKTNAEGEYAAEASTKKEGKVRILDPAEFLVVANKWHDGSTLITNLPVIYGTWGKLHSDSSAWQKAKSSARSDSYNTFSHYDNGPKEFRVAETTLKDGRGLEGAIMEIINGIDYVKVNAPILDAKIRELIAIELDRKDGNPKKAAKAIMEIAKKSYTFNFKNGLEVERFRWGMLPLWGLIGGFAGGLVGGGLDYLGNRYRWYRERPARRFLVST